MGFIGRAWRGDEDLWKVFWLYGVALSVVYVILTKLIGGLVPLKPWLYGNLAVNVLWVVWWTVAIWRCAFNTNWSIWGYLLRLIVLLQIAAIGYITYALIKNPEVGVITSCGVKLLESMNIAKQQGVLDKSESKEANYQGVFQKELMRCIDGSSGISGKLDNDVIQQCIADGGSEAEIEVCHVTTVAIAKRVQDRLSVCGAQVNAQGMSDQERKIALANCLGVKNAGPLQKKAQQACAHLITTAAAQAKISVKEYMNQFPDYPLQCVDKMLGR